MPKLDTVEANHPGNSGGSAPPPPFQKTRWTLALLIVVVVAAVSIAELMKGVRPACQVTTVTHTGGSTGGTATTKACGMLNVTDYIYVLAIIGVLLLPDAKSLKIGGLEFQRLTTEVAKQNQEMGELRQAISTVVSSTNNLSVQISDVSTRLSFADFRGYFRQQWPVFQKIRPLLTRNPQTVADLRKIDDVAKRIDAPDISPFELMEVTQRMDLLLGMELITSGTEGDEVEGAQKAEDVLPSIVRGHPATS